jgi:hypothetical protein
MTRRDLVAAGTGVPMQHAGRVVARGGPKMRRPPTPAARPRTLR